MAITTQDFTTLVRNQVAAIQGAASKLVDFTVGSINLAYVQSNAALALWLQGLILGLIALTRAATSVGSDLTSWMADFSFDRLPAVFAHGNETFARFTATTQAVVPIGATVQTADGTQNYTVILDATNGNYNSGLGGYVLAINTASIAVPIQATVAGSAANALTGRINVLTQSIPGIDTVTNGADFTNGIDTESDSAFIVRFRSYIASLSKGTKGAIGYAISSIAQGVTYTLTENFNYNGSANNGFFYAVVDDGTGAPSSGFLDAVRAAVELVRGFTITYAVFAPVVVTANIAATLVTANNHSSAVTLATSAVASYINSLPLGASLNYTRLSQVIYDSSPDITNVTGLTINSATADVAATAKQVIKIGTNAIA